MKKKRILTIASLVLIVFIVVFGLYKLFSNYKTTSQLETLPAPATAINRSTAINDNGYLTYLIEGSVENITSTNPLTISILVKTNTILTDYTEPLIKTITLEEGTDFVIRELATNKETITKDYKSIKQGDDVVAWLKEPNTKLLELDNFTATKIIINH